MKKILLIEDDTETRENTAEILDLANYTVVIAENGSAGVEQAKKEKPDLIICDVMLPNLDGYGVLAALNKDPATIGIPFIFMTAKAEKSDLRKGMSLGADDYLTKPVREAELLNAIRVRLNRVEFFKKSFSRDINGLVDFINEAKKFNLPTNITADYRTHHFKEKEAVFMQGDMPSNVFFINSGKVKTWKVNPDGKEFIADIFSSGEFFGYVPILEGHKYPDSATTLEDSEIAFIPKNDFISLIYSNNEVSVQFIRMLANDIHDKKERLLRLAYNTVRSRVAAALCNIYKKQPGSQSIKISRDDLANIIGTSTESLIRTLSDFKREFLIETDGREIKVLNPYKLEAVAKEQ
jgi:DNA-binding response OmpR family regulator